MGLIFTGVHFDTSSSSLVNEITTAIKVYAYGVEDFSSDPTNGGRSLNTQLSCEGAGAARWDTGDRFFRYLRNVSVETETGRPNLEFTQDGVLKAADLKIMNLRPGVSKQLLWEEVGYFLFALRVEGIIEPFTYLLNRTTRIFATKYEILCIFFRVRCLTEQQNYHPNFISVQWSPNYYMCDLS